MQKSFYATRLGGLKRRGAGAPRRQAAHSLDAAAPGAVNAPSDLAPAEEGVGDGDERPMIAREADGAPPPIAEEIPISAPSAAPPEPASRSPLSLFADGARRAGLRARKGEASPAIDRRNGARSPEEVVAEHRAILALKKKRTQKQRAEIREATTARPADGPRGFVAPWARPHKPTRPAPSRVPSLASGAETKGVQTKSAQTNDARETLTAASDAPLTDDLFAAAWPDDTPTLDALSFQDDARPSQNPSLSPSMSPPTHQPPRSSMRYADAVNDIAFENTLGDAPAFGAAPATPSQSAADREGALDDNGAPDRERPSSLGAQSPSVLGAEHRRALGAERSSASSAAPGRAWLAARRRQTIRMMSARFDAMRAAGAPALQGPGARTAEEAAGDPAALRLAERPVRARLYLSLRDYLRLTLAASVLGLEEEDLAITALNAYFDACGVEAFDDSHLFEQVRKSSL